jgi:hypothetical protein
MASGKGKKGADDEAASAGVNVNVNGHDPNVCGDDSSTTSDALNDELRGWLQEDIKNS